MNRQQLRELLSIKKINDYTWMATLPEIHLMWAQGHSESEAAENWLQQYDSPSFSSLFASILQERAKQPRITVEDAESSTPIERPATVDFPYRGKLYRIATNEGLPKRHIVLPNGTILVVCRWTGRVPACLADIRRSPEPMASETIALQLDGVLAEEVPLQPGQTTKAMAILDFEGQRYAIDYGSNALIEMPDGRLYRIEATHYPEEPVRIATIIPFDPHHSSMPYQLERFGKTPAIPVAADYLGMASRPRDLRIRFTHQGERYILSHEAYEQGKWIVYIPDYGFFRIGIYLESMPVQLGELSPIASSIASSQSNRDNTAVALRVADAVDVEPWREQ
jgi:hypothetical protein